MQISYNGKSRSVVAGGRDGEGQKGGSTKEFHKSFGNNSTSGEASQVALVVKKPPANAGDVRDAGSIPGLGRSPGGGNGDPLQYSCLDFLSSILPWTEKPAGYSPRGLKA